MQSSKSGVLSTLLWSGLFIIFNCMYFSTSLLPRLQTVTLVFNYFSSFFLATSDCHVILLICHFCDFIM